MGRPQKYSGLSDVQLLALYQSNKEQLVLAELFLRYRGLIFGVCNKYFDNEEKAEDATMDIYCALTVKLHDHHVNNFRSWLYVITKNYCLNQLHAYKKLPRVELQPEELTQSQLDYDIDAALQREEQFNLLENCLKQLSVEQQQIVKLFHLENKCYKEIAEVTGNDQSRVRSLIQNGRRNLKICMEKNA